MIVEVLSIPKRAQISRLRWFVGGGRISGKGGTAEDFPSETEASRVLIGTHAEAPFCCSVKPTPCFLLILALPVLFISTG